jgi:hypothetical protein
MLLLATLKRRPLNGQKRTLLSHAAVLLAQGGVLIAFAGSFGAMHGFPLDDAWIHQVIARTFAETGTLGYVAGHHGAAATSYLFAALLSINFRIVHADPVTFTLALNVVFALGAGQCLLSALRTRELIAHDRAASDPGADYSADAKSVIVTVLATLGGNFVWFAFSGMEATLVVFLSLLAIVAVAHDAAPTRTRMLVAGVAAGALALTRPEGAILGPLIAAWLLWSRRSRRDAALVAAPWAAGLALYVGSNLVKTGSAAPATLTGRRWLWLEDSGLGWPAQVVAFVDAWLLRLREYTLGTSANIAFWISLGCAVVGVTVVVRSKSSAMKLVLAWALVHLVTYAVILPTLGHGGRYQPLTPLVYLLLVALGSVELLDAIAAWIVRTRRGVVRIVLAVIATAPWFALVSVGVRDWRADHTKAVAHVRTTEVGLGRVIDALPKDARVASFDIGGSGFFAHRTILDIGGLVDARAVPLMKAGRIDEYLRDNRVDYVILPMGYAPLAFPDPINFGQRLHLLENPAVDLELVRVLDSPHNVWAPSIRSTANASPRQNIYRISYTGREGPLPRATPSEAGWSLDDAGAKVARADREPLKHGLAVLAGYGVHVHVRVSAERDAQRRAATGEWRVELGPWGVVALPPAGGLVPADAVTGLIAEWVQPYLEMRDSGGAGRLALHAIATAHRRFVDARFHPSLPPGRIAENGEDSVPRTTSLGGIALALVVAGIAFALRRLRARFDARSVEVDR